MRIFGDGQLYKNLEQLAVDLYISERVAHLGAKIQSEIVSELNSADIYLMRSIAEGVPVACMEATAMDRPIIATNIIGLTELIDNNPSGLLVPPNNSHALANTIGRLLLKPIEQCEIGKAARKKVEQDFNRAINTRLFINV